MRHRAVAGLRPAGRVLGLLGRLTSLALAAAFVGVVRSAPGSINGEGQAVAGGVVATIVVGSIAGAGALLVLALARTGARRAPWVAVVVAAALTVACGMYLAGVA